MQRRRSVGESRFYRDFSLAFNDLRDIQLRLVPISVLASIVYPRCDTNVLGKLRPPDDCCCAQLFVWFAAIAAVQHPKVNLRKADGREKLAAQKLTSKIAS